MASASKTRQRDASGRFRSSGEEPARPVQVWLKPDVLERLDAYCATYGVGRGRAIGHLLQGALPDPRWFPAGATLLNQDPSKTEQPTQQRVVPAHPSAPQSEPGDPELEALMASPPTQPLFRSGDRVSNRNRTRCGWVAEEPLQWIPAVRLNDGVLRPGHWSYAVAWEDESGLTIRYAEDLLQALA